jgi:hypothetical protein
VGLEEEMGGTGVNRKRATYKDFSQLD